jgi:hypothetical protein
LKSAPPAPVEEWTAPSRLGKRLRAAMTSRMS